MQFSGRALAYHGENPALNPQHHKKQKKKKKKGGRLQVAHAFYPRYSGGRDQEDHGLKPTWANSSRDSISKNPSQKKGLVEWLKG
jgi:hypothetical protein